MITIQLFQLFCSFRWTKNGQPFDWSAFNGRIESASDGSEGSLIINSPWDIDVGQYQCFAENLLGVATANSVFLKKVELFQATDHMLAVRVFFIKINVTKIQFKYFTDNNC